MKAVKPTNDFYGQLQYAYEHFNRTLFDRALPECLITVQREKNTMGFFSPLRWSSTSASDVHEIALNPIYFANRKVIEIFQTLVHEQCHLWQHEFGNPSRSGYHNREWAEKMESIGLMPSSSAQVGGRKVGQKMSDYVIDGGVFQRSCIGLIKKGYQFNWVDRRTNLQGSEDSLKRKHKRSVPTKFMKNSPEVLLELPVSILIPNFVPEMKTTAEKTRYKTKYCCPHCKINVWGKPMLHIRCETCDASFIPE
ncbi:SprT-like domain-containing protein [Herminiimonas fonticola]|uniref:SprT-like family protein n=1 Tax=Herminiimonas fonticola TaxID=303380 RepID=A0A4R6GI38_9BURK|nr:SprT-like domain-containing protein [Herminiimonas fonticola]RBA25503.1 SprT-like family [Herminiimonas fonticola]TDN94616.1 SprT-like family protein [Herminiimonas fonticola]